MKLNQIVNLIEFTLLFNKSCDNSVFTSNYDYIIEKFNTFINVDIKNTHYLKSKKLDDLLIEYTNIWGKLNSYDSDEENKIINIILYLLEINVTIKPNKITPIKMHTLFNKYIGDSNNITKKNNDCRLHFILLKNVITPYIERYDREIKLLTLI